MTSLRSRACFAELADRLRALQREFRLVYVVNTGNWGDALIHAGHDEFFEHFGLRVLRTSLPHITRRGPRRTWRLLFSRRDVLVFSGCVAFHDAYRRVEEVAQLTHAYGRALIMPSTFGIRRDRCGFAEGTELWRRDDFESRNNAPDPRFCHDMAFFLDLPPPPPPSRALGLFLREDVEATGPVPAGNRDLSGEGRHTTPIGPFLDAIAQCETVVTNRLHVAIGGALLGRRVRLLPNSYFKNRAIYETSLAPHYPSVSFHASLDEVPEFGNR